MKAAPQYLGAAGDALVKERLSQYMRYASLVSEQEGALDRADFERFHDLAREIAEVREQIGPAGLDDGEIQPGEAEARDAAEVLKEALTVNRRVQARLAAMKLDNADQIRSVSRRAPQARKYVTEETEAPETHLDVTL